jgi:SAM-dependent methyltransferase
MSDLININTKDYWDGRFSSGDWEVCGGRNQTESFALGQIPHLNIDPEFAGSILDFGCGLGDAIPVYRANFPNASLLGMDISHAAIEKCRAKYGELASFVCGDHTVLPETDIIIASNVFEHLSDDVEIARFLLTRCSTLYVIVPYKENPLHSEHIRDYNEDSFKDLNPVSKKIFVCEGWSQFGKKLLIDVYLKNLFRPIFGRKIVRRSRQIVFKFEYQ